MMRRKISEKIKKQLKKEGYGLVGKHSAVKICKWTKDSLNNKGVCWKEKFYGIRSHKCCQMTPWIECQNRCLHCWRHVEHNLGKETAKIDKIDEPKKIIEESIKARKKLLSGFKSNKNVDKNKLKEALEPTLFALSLIGEPTLYPKLAELIKEIRKQGAISFLVTNGLEPERILELEKKKALPTQLTLSTNAPNEKLFKIWHLSSEKQAWKKFNKTLEIMKKLKGKTRRVVRLTLVKEGRGKNKSSFIDKLSNMREEHVGEYAKLIRKAQPDFIHVKGFMSVGHARKRLGYDKMPWHFEIKNFAKELAKELAKDSYKILAEEKASCVVLLGKSKKNMKIKRGEI